MGKNRTENAQNWIISHTNIDGRSFIGLCFYYTSCPCGFASFSELFYG